MENEADLGLPGESNAVGTPNNGVSQPLVTGGGPPASPQLSVPMLPLVDLVELEFKQLSKSMRDKIARAEVLIRTAATQHQRPDPQRVNSQSSNLVLSILWVYTGLDTATSADDAKAYATFSTMISACRWVYDLAGHRTSWVVLSLPDGATHATGNPARDNAEVASLRKSVRKHLSMLKKSPKSTKALTAELVLSRFERFVGEKNDAGFIDRRDLAVHAISVLSMNLGLRYDEVKKIEMGTVTATLTCLSFAITERSKNHTETKEYQARAWPGELAKAAGMDPFLAVLLWIDVRGDHSGPLFCEVIGDDIGQYLNFGKSWPVDRYCHHLRKRAMDAGWSERDANCITGHSGKRGCVQLYRLLGVSDTEIMELCMMASLQAYMRYCELSEASSRRDLPKFRDHQSFMAHARELEECREYAESDGESDEDDSEGL